MFRRLLLSMCTSTLLWAGTVAPSWSAPTPPALDVANVGANPSWNGLTASQQSVLKPLQAQWSELEPSSKDKWLSVANRYPKLPPAEQARVQERMTQWAKLPPKARGEARLRFQQTRQVPAEVKQEKWAAYQALSAEEKKALAQKATRRQHPVFLADNMAGPREKAQVYSGRVPVTKTQEKKQNVVPSTLTSAPRPTTAAPSLVKASRGATTSLINERPTAPLHQQTGLPKIAATKGFVDPQTLLPKKGPQGAAMLAEPGSAPASGHHQNRR